MPSINYEYVPFAGEALSVTGTAIGVTTATAFPGVGLGAKKAVGDVQVAAVRFRLDGTAPTATVGHIAEVGDAINLDEPNEVVNFSAIRKDGVTATIFFTFER